MARRGTVRIIAGQWRGRRVHFPAAGDLRPTADRRRETLFNWLGADLSGYRCLDLFAGSGALGFEAASRGADAVVLVESSRAAVRALQESKSTLCAERVTIAASAVERYLQRGPATPFDIVFVDPPFARPRLIAATLAALDHGWLAPGARVYVESATHAPVDAAPREWTLEREASGGDAHGRLYRVADLGAGNASRGTGAESGAQAR